MIQLKPLSHAILATTHLALREGINDGYVTIDDIRQSFPIRISDAFLRRATNEILHQGYIQYNRKNDTVIIHNKGIKYYDSQLKKNDSFISHFEKDRMGFFEKYGGELKAENEQEWNQPDWLGEISQKDIDEIKILLRKILETLQGMEFNQQEYAQASGPVRASHELIEMPRPPLGKLKELLQPLSSLQKFLN